MKLAEALKIVQTASHEGAEEFSVYLACGFLPLHFATFLHAQLRLLLPERVIKVETGLYGDPAGNIERLNESTVGAGVVAFEWSDFDPRLGLRSVGGWAPEQLDDIVSDAETARERYLQLLRVAAQSKQVVVSMPTLPLPPISFHPSEQAGITQLRLEEIVSGFALELVLIPNVKILNQQQLENASPVAERRDVKAEFASGFPYRLAHASILAGMLAHLIQPVAAKKGLITDLDDTLWRGLLGEDGVDGISWSLDQQSHIHALYQQVLLALSKSGVLVAIASKNDPSLAAKALGREDLIMPRNHLFPIEVNWQPKSEAVTRILEAWNISADSVVFVDDSPMELAEVKEAHPDVECFLFPRNNDDAAYELLQRLRGLFGKEQVLMDDKIRSKSLQQGREVISANATPGLSVDSFLARLDAELVIDVANDPSDFRAFELINKTNQFNLNGIRLTKADFDARLAAPGAFLLTVSYKDKYGSLGKIAAALGSVKDKQLELDSWVMSCRAFSRRIEHKSLEYLFDKFALKNISFNFQPTERNRPLQDFLAAVLGTQPAPGCTLSHETFVSNRPELHQSVKELVHA